VPDDRTEPDGFWPSDHAGSLAKIRLDARTCGFVAFSPRRFGGCADETAVRSSATTDIRRFRPRRR
jgi:hypothetical protein